MVRTKKIPQRICVGCGETKDKKALIRVVRTPEGEILFDPTGKKSGRGAYLCVSQDCLNKAIKAKRLEKALKQAITPDVIEQLKAQLGDV
ncbi:YlxR family protein [Heliorestis acidaminivorans]|uniref:YlxR family protein n=1 Tax=Heliorestis acidaminivorans TaxID=553427 RepID=A0A6I0EVE3_9FIRM|nr:YlxR family protein [Heliorestis acidaminivorans]KAB2954354.1 YlxR family protein [Heliorestis acidaminivorans]